MGRRHIYVNTVPRFHRGLKTLFMCRDIMSAGEDSGTIHFEAQSLGSKLHIPQGTHPGTCSCHLDDCGRIDPPQSVVRDQVLYEFLSYVLRRMVWTC